MSTADAPDGRSRRWESHRQSRRDELVRLSAAAIEEHGPEAHIGVIAAAAGVSKPVLYRYFTDKDDLLAATARWGAEEIVTAITEALRSAAEPRDAIGRAVDAYLTQVSQHRHLFLLVTRHHGQAVDGSLAYGKSAAAAVLARALSDAARSAGVQPAAAEAWAHGLVGLGVSTAEWWLEHSSRSQDDVAGYLTAFIWHAFDGIRTSSAPEFRSRG